MGDSIYRKFIRDRTCVVETPKVHGRAVWFPIRRYDPCRSDLRIATCWESELRFREGSLIN